MQGFKLYFFLCQLALRGLFFLSSSLADSCSFAVHGLIFF